MHFLLFRWEESEQYETQGKCVLCSPFLSFDVAAIPIFWSIPFAKKYIIIVVGVEKRIERTEVWFDGHLPTRQMRRGRRGWRKMEMNKGIYNFHLSSLPSHIWCGVSSSIFVLLVFVLLILLFQLRTQTKENESKLIVVIVMIITPLVICCVLPGVI